MDLSVTIPVRDEEENLPELIRRLQAVFQAMGVSYEIILITDLNRDNTYGLIKEFNRRDERIKGIKLSNAFGHHVAVLAGLHHCRGRSVLLMDGDLQDLPEDIPKLYAKLQEGFDVVYGIKEKKDEAAWRNWASRAFLRLMARLSDQPLEFNTCMFRMISRKTVEALGQFREDEPSLTALMSLINFPTAAVAVSSGSRFKGRTKFNLRRQLNFAISFLLSFSTKPLRILSAGGLIIALLSLLYLPVVIFQKLFLGIPVSGWATIIVLITFLGGAQLFGLGLIGEYIGRIFVASKNRPLYIIEDRIGDLEPPQREQTNSEHPTSNVPHRI
ncbi:MAG: glycosyltransferase family 2 protein [Deltaproteobacteria bacterium]|nr:glycosyltransferase family 2 protein [Deltaproteobacteria bacterium]